MLEPRQDGSGEFRRSFGGLGRFGFLAAISMVIIIASMEI